MAPQRSRGGAGRAAIDAFLSQPDLASTTRATYRQTLTVLEYDRRRTGHRPEPGRRRVEKHDHTRSIPMASLERLWERHDTRVRTRTRWPR